MDISKFKIVTSFLFGGGVTGVIEYVLDILNKALANIGDATKEKVQAALNLALKVLNVLNALKWLVPTKWQSAYLLTCGAVQECVTSLSDLTITKDELDKVADKVSEAVKAWKSPDDETCVEMKSVAAAIVAVALLCAGCVYKGAKVTEGTDLAIGMNVPVSEGTLQLQALNYLSGFRLGVDRNAILRCKYTVAETNDYLGCVHTRVTKTMDATVEPCESSATADGGDAGKTE